MNNLMKFLKSTVRNLSLRRKIYGMLVSSILLVSFFAFVSISIVSRAYQKQLYRTIATSLSYTTSEISNQLNNAETIADIFLSDSNIQNNLITLKDSESKAEQTSAYQSLYQLLNDYYYNFQSNHIRYLEFNQGQFSIHTTSLHNTSVPEELKTLLTEKALAKQGGIVWVTGYSTEYGIYLVRQIRRAKIENLDNLGVLIVNIDIEQMINDLNISLFDSDELYSIVYDSEGNMIYNSLSDTESEASLIDQFQEAYCVVKLNGQQYFAVKSQIPDYQWTYIHLIPYNSIVRSLAVARNICFLVLLLSIAFSIIMSSRLLNSLLYHLDNLNRKMEAFGKGQEIPTYEVCDYKNRADEIGRMHVHFDSMVQEIEHLIESNYIQELQKKEAELKALEYQINPHFLYNTLESINWRAKAVGESSISSMVEALGKMLRITLNKDQTSCDLRQELDLVQSYLVIQKIRFGDQLVYSMDVPDEYDHIPIPKLTIQPLVENAIHYGLETNIEQCHIIISVERTGSLLSIYVKNNGSEFENDLLQKLQNQEVIPNGLGIGLLNIDKRLKLTFGSDFGLRLYNEGETAVASFSIPIHKE